MGVGRRRIRRGGGDRPVRSVCRWVEVSGSGCCARRSRPGSSTARRGRTRRPSSLSGSLTGPNGPAAAAGSTRGRPGAASRPLARRGSRDRGGGGSGCLSAPRGRAGTDRAGAGPAGPVGRGVAAAAPGMRWVGGVAHGPARRGFAYPAVVVDCFPGKGRRARDRRSHARRTRRRGLGHGRAGPVRRSVVSGSSARVGGARCAWAGCTGFMAGRGVLPSVGRTGSCCGSAVAESFTAVSREELVNRGVRSARDHAIRDVTARTGSRCDHRRLHSAIDHRTPDQVDTEWRQQHKTAARDHPSTTT